MSFNRIYGYGETPHKAFITSKMNEIECNSRTIFLGKTGIYAIDIPNGITCDLLELYIIGSCNLKDIKTIRRITETESKYYHYLLDFYGTDELEKIYMIYKDLDRYKGVALCINTGNLFEGFNVYKFLF